MRLLGGIQRALDGYPTIVLVFALLFDFNVSAGGRSNRIDVAAGAANNTRNRMNWHLYLFACILFVGGLAGGRRQSGSGRTG